MVANLFFGGNRQWSGSGMCGTVGTGRPSAIYLLLLKFYIAFKDE